MAVAQRQALASHAGMALMVLDRSKHSRMAFCRTSCCAARSLGRQGSLAGREAGEPRPCRWRRSGRGVARFRAGVSGAN